ncbi:SDR family NAD(P)-dependent oxidoreductase [Hydrogenophaga sp. NFH-34]|uniref:SDR family NAD(P)-dependent oxidoreductase n=1 Tax=Hydrogenophaga sp. NFH-34 TaxID=2744446 RepID=UPI001F32557A|nr:SDR family NAD(P)-dependent oxidoreductase [Hydrogenophaga sp. NFH-34]
MSNGHSLRFQDRVALVTGGASGIGLAVVDRLVREGARVAIWDIDGGKLARCHARHGDRVLVQTVDVGDAAAIEAAMAETVARWQRLDILVNGAGIVGPNGPFWETEVAQWERVVRINLTGSFLVSRAATPHLRHNGWGRIVNIASVTANEGPRHLGPYAATKAGVVGLTKSMGKDLAGSGVLVNAITPALIATELLEQLTPEYMAAALARIPLGRPGTLDEAAALVTWLCSEECSFSTGASYDLSGGRGV